MFILNIEMDVTYYVGKYFPPLIFFAIIVFGIAWLWSNISNLLTRRKTEKEVEPKDGIVQSMESETA